MPADPEHVAAGGRARGVSFGVPGLWVWAAMALSLGLLFGPAFFAHLHRALDPRYANNDALQQIYPFFRYEDHELLRGDAIADYFLACLPWGYRGLYTLAAWSGGAAALSKWLPYVSLLFVVGCIATCAHRFAGRAGAWVAVALSLGAQLFLWRMSGGLPRGFAFPLLGAAMVALCYGRMLGLALLVPIAAAFYPVSAVVIGLALGLSLLLLPAGSRGNAASWSLRKRALVLAASAGVSALVLLPTLASTRGYGSVIRPTEAAEFPEVGPDGRYGADSRAPFPGFFREAASTIEESVRGAGRPLFKPAYEAAHIGRVALGALLGLFALGGLLSALRVRQDARRLAMLPLAALIGHTASLPLVPYLYLPPRYVLYPIGVLAPVLVATAAAGYLCWSPRWREQPRATAIATALAGLLLLLALGARGTTSRGLNDLVGDQGPVLRAIAELPKDALVAGWPKGLLDSVPYVTRRPVLLNAETHQAFHVKFALEMRRRMHALIDAYFGTSRESLLALRDDFHVTHLLIDRRHFAGRPPGYFQPFKGRIKTAAARGRGDYEVLRQAERGRPIGEYFVLIDLHTI